MMWRAVWTKTTSVALRVPATTSNRLGSATGVLHHKAFGTMAQSLDHPHDATPGQTVRSTDSSASLRNNKTTPNNQRNHAWGNAKGKGKGKGKGNGKGKRHASNSEPSKLEIHFNALMNSFPVASFSAGHGSDGNPAQATPPVANTDKDAYALYGFRDRMRRLFIAADRANDRHIARQAFLQFDRCVNPKEEPRAKDYLRALKWLLGHGDARDHLIRIYERSVATYSKLDHPMPEVFYRYGVHGKCLQGDPDTALEIIGEMVRAGHSYPNECCAEVMRAFAKQDKHGNKEKIVALFDQLEPTRGEWTTSSINQVIRTLGGLHEPKRAFDFYVNSNMKLDGETLLTLLECCRVNDCKQQASNILENRKRFDLDLDTNMFNYILETLEWMQQPEELLSVLQEMEQKSIAMNQRTEAVIERNQAAVQGSSFDYSLQSDELSEFQMARTNRTLKKLLAQHQTDQAQAMARKFLTTLQRQQGLLPEKPHPDLPPMPEPYYTPRPKPAEIPVEMADLLVEASLQKPYDKELVEELLRSFSSHHGRYGRALGQLFVTFQEEAIRDPANREYLSFAYTAMQALEFQGVESNNHKRHLDVLALQAGIHGDPVSCHKFQDVLALHMAEIKNRDERLQLLERRVRSILQLNVVNAQRLLDLVYPVAKQELRSRRDLFVWILGSLGNKTEKRRVNGTKTYDSGDQILQTVKRMEKEGIDVDKHIINLISNNMCFSSKRHRLWILEKYQELEEDGHSATSGYKYSPKCYRDLLECCRRSVESALAEEIFAHARKTYPDYVPLQWWPCMIRLYIDRNDMNNALKHTLDMIRERSSVLLVDCTTRLLDHFAEKHKWDKFDELMANLKEYHPEFFNFETICSLGKSIARSGDGERMLEVLTLLETSLSRQEMSNIFQNKRKIREMRELYQSAVEMFGQGNNYVMEARLEKQQRAFLQKCQQATSELKREQPEQ